MSRFHYEKNTLVIMISTTDPAAMHVELMKGLTGAMKNYIICNERDDAQISLVNLLEHLLPGEKLLSKINE